MEPSKSLGFRIHSWSPFSRQPYAWARVVVFEGLLGLLVLIADVWAILNVFQSSESTGSKALWTVLVLVLPVLGFAIWYFAGPKARSG